MRVRSSLQTAGGLVLALFVGFLLGSSIQPLRSQPSTAQPVAPPTGDALVERLVREADETGRQMRTDVTALTELMKRVIREVEFGGWYPELNDQGRLLGERIGVDVEVAVAQTLLAVAEKSVVRNRQEEWVVGRIVDFFQASRADVQRYREKGYPLSSVILGYGIAKAAKASPEQVFELREMGQSWPAVAVTLGVKPQELGKALQGLFP